MAPVSKRRKTSTSFDPSPPRIAVVVPARNSIASFTRVSKPAAAAQGAKASKDSKTFSANVGILQELNNGVEKVHGFKRKPENDLRTPVKNLKTQSGRAQAVKPSQENDLPTIHEIRSTTPEPPSLPKPVVGKTQTLKTKEPDTPTKATRSRLEAFTLSSSPSKNQLKVSALFPSTSSPAAPTPCPKKRRREDELPDEVQDLVDLHSSFLSVLNLTYVHNGTSTPVDLKHITPGIGKAWGRRNPTTDDVRRVLALQQRSAESVDEAALLSLWTYSRGRICIEYCEPADARTWGKTRQALHTQKLSRAFSAYVREQFALSQEKGITAADFIEGLPLARLHKRATSKAQKSTLLSKGQTRLTDLKQGAIKAQKRNEPVAKSSSVTNPNEQAAATFSPPKPAATTPLRPSQRGDSLLSRIRAKESFLASQPAGPTQAQLDRRSALQRMPEVINVLSLLAGNSSSSISPGRGLAASPMAPTGRSSDDELAAMLGMSSPSSHTPSNRGMQAMFGAALISNVSMSLHQAVERVQNSMRTPISANEVESVVRLLASEVCPEWIQLRELGSVRGVTLRGSGPARGWREKVQELIAMC